jgi:hypothetical protein
MFSIEKYLAINARKKKILKINNKHKNKFLMSFWRSIQTDINDEKNRLFAFWLVIRFYTRVCVSVSSHSDKYLY